MGRLLLLLISLSNEFYIISLESFPCKIFFLPKMMVDAASETKNLSVSYGQLSMFVTTMPLNEVIPFKSRTESQSCVHFSSLF